MKRKTPIARLIVFILMAAVILITGFAPTAYAANTSPFLQTDQPKMTVTPAYSGYFKYGEWLPVWVELENQARDMEAEVRVTVVAAQGTVVFSAPVSLPAGSRKRLPVYVLPNNFSREVSVELISGGKSVLSQKATIRPQPNISYFVGLLAPQRGALALLNGIKIPGQERPMIIADLTVEELPDRAEGLRSFDLLVLNDMDTSKLTPEQANALSGWVGQGGQLVIGGGAGAQQSTAGLPAGLLPAQVLGTAEIQVDGLAPLAAFARYDPIQSQGKIVTARAELADNTAHILTGDTALPLVVERVLGSGRVIFVALDLAGVPFNGWPGTVPFWEVMLGQNLAFPQNMPFDISARQMRADQLVYPLSNIPSLDLPSIRGLAILLIIYILIVGPLNFLILRRMRRLQLAWLTIPVITILFTAASFGIGYMMRGNDLVLNKISLVQLKPGGNAFITSYMGLFSPRAQSYEVAVEGEGLISPMTGQNNNDPWMNNGGAPQGGMMTFTQGSPARVKGLTVNQWAIQSFMSEGSWSGFGEITGELSIENEVLVGTLRNETSAALKDVVLAIQNRFVRLGDMAPGAEATINLGISNLSTDRNGNQLSYRLFQENFDGGMPSRSNELKASIVNTVFENTSNFKDMLSSRLPAGTSSMNSGILVFGWIDQAPPVVSVPGNRLTQQGTGLVYTMLAYKIPEAGFLSLPPGLIPGNLVKMPPDSGSCGMPGSASIHMGAGQAEFEFHIPEGLRGLKVDALKLSVWRDNGDPTGIPEISLLDWANQSWLTIENPILGTNVIQKAAGFVDENGLIRVQITSKNNNFGCTYLDLGLEGTRAAGQGRLP